MPVKQLEVPGIGTVKLYKRRNTRSVKVTLTADYVRVSLPMWLPYRAGLEFVRAKSKWINQHRRPARTMIDGAGVGKAHRLNFKPSTSSSTISTRVSDTQINVSYPSSITPIHPDVQIAAKKASLKALRHEANNLLPQRLDQLAAKHNFIYESVRVRSLKSRWGSCSQQKNISLNIFLMQLPWQLIDYVLIHELTHTKYLNHSSDFWQHMEQCVPNVKVIRKELRTYHPAF